MLLNGLMHAVQTNSFGSCAESTINYIIDIINKNEDPDCTRLACGIISDIANVMEKSIGNHLQILLPAILQILKSNDYESETKPVAIQALSDVTLQS